MFNMIINVYNIYNLKKKITLGTYRWFYICIYKIKIKPIKYLPTSTNMVTICLNKYFNLNSKKLLVKIIVITRVLVRIF